MRSQKEINSLMDTYEKYFKKIAQRKETHENEVRIRVLGRWEELLSKRAREKGNMRR